MPYHVYNHTSRTTHARKNEKLKHFLSYLTTKAQAPLPYYCEGGQTTKKKHGNRRWWTFRGTGKTTTITSHRDWNSSRSQEAAALQVPNTQARACRRGMYCSAQHLSQQAPPQHRTKPKHTREKGIKRQKVLHRLKGLKGFLAN